jgi:cytochrome c peroxidase
MKRLTPLVACLLVVLMPVRSLAVKSSAPPSLKTVRVPDVPGLERFVKDPSAAIVLGKALFWDQQLGSDGVMSCAVCHFHAGADTRIMNMINPGPNGLFDTGSVNTEVEPEDFPSHRLEDMEDNSSEIVYDSDDPVASQGVVQHQFVAVVPGSAQEEALALPDPVFHVDGENVRQVMTRSAPTMINAIFNQESFLDGRAENVFNGINLSGRKDPFARVLEMTPWGDLRRAKVHLMNSSLASQAVAPPVSPVEMSFEGRSFPLIGRKLLSLRPLAQQEVHPDDSVLGRFRDPSGKGLSISYAALIQNAFQDRWWNSDFVVDTGQIVVGQGKPVDAGQFTLMESNFSLFLGLAIQMYESTLVSDDSPFDRFREGDEGALTDQQKEGLDIFLGDAACIECHGGPEFTEAAVGHFNPALGFTNNGSRPIAEDPGTKHGRFKTPTLRNVELTGPYFHNGGLSTLRQVVEFYDRGGDFPGPHVNSRIQPLEMEDEQEDALVAFMLSLTDARVRHEMAPFDHPSLSVPNGPEVAAVGASGGEALGTFLGLSPFEGPEEDGDEGIRPPLPAQPAGPGVIVRPHLGSPHDPSFAVTLAAPQRLDAWIFDVAGRRVRTLAREERPAGVSNLVWDGRDENGAPVARGMYFVRVQTPVAAVNRKVLLLR